MVSKGSLKIAECDSLSLFGVIGALCASPSCASNKVQENVCNIELDLQIIRIEVLHQVLK